MRVLEHRGNLALLLVVMALLCAVCIAAPIARESYITRKSHLYDAGITLQSPHVRALNTGGR
jgi:hypothetical protein